MPQDSHVASEEGQGSGRGAALEQRTIAYLTIIYEVLYMQSVLIIIIWCFTCRVSLLSSLNSGALHAKSADEPDHRPRTTSVPSLPRRLHKRLSEWGETAA